jgi:hypothetical protein
MMLNPIKAPLAYLEKGERNQNKIERIASAS